MAPREAEKIVDSMPRWLALVIGLSVAALPWAFLIGAIIVAWWMAGAVLSLTVGQMIVWALFFGAGYALGSQR